MLVLHAACVHCFAVSLHRTTSVEGSFTTLFPTFVVPVTIESVELRCGCSGSVARKTPEQKSACLCRTAPHRRTGDCLSPTSAHPAMLTPPTLASPRYTYPGCKTMMAAVANRSAAALRRRSRWNSPIQVRVEFDCNRTTTIPSFKSRRAREDLLESREPPRRSAGWESPRIRIQIRITEECRRRQEFFPVRHRMNPLFAPGGSARTTRKGVVSAEVTTPFCVRLLASCCNAERNGRCVVRPLRRPLHTLPHEDRTEGYVQHRASVRAGAGNGVDRRFEGPARNMEHAEGPLRTIFFAEKNSAAKKIAAAFLRLDSPVACPACPPLACPACTPWPGRIWMQCRRGCMPISRAAGLRT